MNNLNKFNRFIIFLLFTPSIYASPICEIGGGGVLDDIVKQFTTIATTWGNQVEPIAQKFFYILFATEFLWQISVKKVFSGDIEKLWVFFFTRITLSLFFAKYLVNIEVYQGIVNYMVNLGGVLGHFQINMSNGDPYITLGPSEILSYFNCIAATIHEITDKTGSFEYVTQKFTLAILQVVVFITLIFIATILIKNLLEAYFILYAGFLLTGFLGSSWTMNFWQRYIGAVANVAIKLFITCLLMGVLSGFVKEWVGMLATISGVNMIGVLWRIFGGIITMAFLIYRIPEWGAKLLAGEINILKDDSNLKVLSSHSTREVNTSLKHQDTRALFSNSQHAVTKLVKQDLVFRGGNSNSTGQESNFFK